MTSTIFELTFLDGQTRVAAAQTFSGAKVVAAYKRYTEEGCDSHKELTVSELNNRRLPIHGLAWNGELDVAKKLGQKKTVFSLWPINRYVKHGPFFMADGHYWLERVVLTWTLNGWIAYADENGS